MTLLSTDHINVDLRYVGNILFLSVWEYCKRKYSLAFCQINFEFYSFVSLEYCHLNN